MPDAPQHALESVNMAYRSVEWHTDGNGQIKEIAVEYERTFWQWLFKKPATERRWRLSPIGDWWACITENTMYLVTERWEITEISEAMTYIARSKRLQDL